MSGAEELSREEHQEEVPVLEAAAVPQPPEVLSVGARLRMAREARAMDVDAVAAALKLSRRQVEALENGDWGSLPGHTFIRGFVRNYARVVHLDPQTLLADLEAPPPTSPRLDLPRRSTAVMPEPGQAKKRDYAAVLVGLVLVAVAVVAYYVVPADFWVKAPQPEPVVKETVSPQPLFPPGTTPGSPLQGATVPAEAAPAALSAAQASAVAPDSLLVAPTNAPSGAGLRMVFAQPSWVEIRDKSGQIIFSQLNPAGSERLVDGTPPFALVVGNAQHVKVQYNGRDIELQPRSKDDVARVTVE